MVTFPAISGADPCTASARAMPPSPILQLHRKVNDVRQPIYHRRGLKIDIICTCTYTILYLGVKPKPPINPAQRSLIISP
jgi:hypothetical protein